MENHTSDRARGADAAAVLTPRVDDEIAKLLSDIRRTWLVACGEAGIGPTYAQIQAHKQRIRDLIVRCVEADRRRR